MGTFFKVVGALVVVAVLLAGGGLAYLAIRKPAMRPPSAEKIEATPARLARGEYLTLHVSDCLECHSDFTSGQFCLPPKPGTEGQGGYPFDKRLGVPGVVQAQNITPDPETGIGRWSDGEVMRAIREGVNKDGEALFPQMPYPYLRSMSDEDVRSVVAYLRTLKPIHHPIQKRKLDFPVNFLVKNVPRPVDGPVTMPDPEKDHLGYGKYLVTIAGCQECHTAHDNHGQLVGRTRVRRRLGDARSLGKSRHREHHSASRHLHRARDQGRVHRADQVFREPDRRALTHRSQGKEHDHAVASILRHDERGPGSDLRLLEDLAADPEQCRALPGRSAAADSRASSCGDSGLLMRRWARARCERR